MYIFGIATPVRCVLWKCCQKVKKQETTAINPLPQCCKKKGKKNGKEIENDKLISVQMIHYKFNDPKRIH